MQKFLDIQAITNSFEPELSAAIQRVVESGWFLHGKENQLFEAEFAQYLHQRFCIGVANGLDALFLVLEAKKQLSREEKSAMCATEHNCCADKNAHDGTSAMPEAVWEDGDEVIVPAMTFVATAQAVVRAGLRPVLVEVTENALLDVEKLEAALTSRTRAIVPVHLYGQTANVSAIKEFAERHKLFVLEDAAQAHGGQDVVCYGHAAAYSFYPGKNLGALGDGGAVVTNDAALAARVRAIANYGSEEKYNHVYRNACNSRLAELQAAVLRVKLHRLTADNARRQAIARRYYSGINNPLVKLLPQHGAGAVERSVWHIFPIFCENRASLQAHLREQGVETLIHYPRALDRQPTLDLNVQDTKPSAYPIATRIANTELSLPMSPLMTDAEVDAVIASVNNFTEQ